MLDNNLCATKCEVKRSSTFHKVRIAVAAPDCRRAFPNPSRPSTAVAWPKPDSRTQNSQPRRDAQSCNPCSHENLVCLFSLHMFGLNGSAFKETQPVIPPIISCINIQLIMLHDALPLLGVSADMDGGSSTTTDTDCLVQMLMQMYLLHHKIHKVLEVQDNHEGWYRLLSTLPCVAQQHHSAVR